MVSAGTWGHYNGNLNTPYSYGSEDHSAHTAIKVVKAPPLLLA